MANDTELVPASPKIEGEIPEPQISGEPQGQPLGQAGGSAVDFSALESNPDFKAFIEKQVQSVKDVRFGKMGTEIKDLRKAVSQYDSLVAGGMSKEQALAIMEGDQELTSLKERLAKLEGGDTSDVSAGAGAQTWEERQQTILSKHKLEKDDPRLAELLKAKSWGTYDKYLEELDKVANDWSFSDKQKPQPSSSTVAQTVPSVVPVAGEFDDYSSDQLGEKLIALSKNPTVNRAEMDVLDAELARRDTLKE